jgi:hypothetical protein
MSFSWSWMSVVMLSSWSWSFFVVLSSWSWMSDCHDIQLELDVRLVNRSINA